MAEKDTKTYKVKIHTSVAMAAARGMTVSPEKGDEVELEDERFAKRLCWRGYASPIGWNPGKCPEDQTPDAEVYRYNLEHGIVTPETAPELAKRRKVGES